MSTALYKISPHNLQLGMYVEQLDRPWLETPLPFQGFYIRSEEEIRRIKQCCEYVYVDSGKSDQSISIDFSNPSPPRSEFLAECVDQINKLSMGPAQSTTLNTGSTLPLTTDRARPVGRGALSFLKRILPRQRQRPEAKSDQELVKEQVGFANRTYEQAQKIMSGVMADLRAGGTLDVSVVEKVVAPVIDSILHSTDAMACVVRMKEADDYTYNHSLGTSIWSAVFGKSLGFDRDNLQILGMGGLLLDIGKTRIPKELFVKTDPLEPHELQEIRRHVEYGLEILQETNNIHPKVEEMVRTHHERHDGSGYPDGRSGQDIPVFGRIGGIVDTYDAMTSLRPYAPAMSTYNVMRHLVDQADTLFQAEIVERFIQVVGIFPTATLVELNTGEVGVVVEQNPVRRLRPKIIMILDDQKVLRKAFPVIDLGQMPAQTSDPHGIWIIRGLEPGSFGIDPREYYL